MILTSVGHGLNWLLEVFCFNIRLNYVYFNTVISLQRYRVAAEINKKYLMKITEEQ